MADHAEVRATASGEDGFTLVEMIMGAVIVTLIAGAIGSALVVGMRTTDATTRRLSESHDLQISSAYLANDVQSAKSITVDPGTGNCASTRTLVTFTFAGTGKVATYACGPASGQTRVTRTFAGSTVVLAHFAANAAPNVTCTGCGGSSPASVRMGFTEASGLTYTLSGVQRATNPTSPGSGSDPPDFSMFVLAGGAGSPLWVSGSCPKGQIDNPGHPDNDCTADSEQGGASQPKLTVIGNLYVNSAISGAVRLSGMKNQRKLEIQGGDFKILSPGTCSGCTGNTVRCVPDCPSSPPPGSYTTPLVDPFRFMSAPTETGLPVYNDGVYHGPGVYTTELRISSNTTMASGVYVLNNGFSLTGNANLGGTDVTFYVKGGTFSVGGNTTFDVHAPTSGQYKGIIIFQSRTNTNPISLLGSSGVTSIGTIYAPASTLVTLGQGNASLRVATVIAQTVKVTGSSQVTIGPS